jgi:hypothetical protein
VAEIYEQYTRDVREALNYLATWLPNVHMSLGDVGRLRRDRFDRRSSLEQLGLPFEARPSAKPIDLQYTSGADVKISFNASAAAANAGDILGPGSASITVEFSRANSVVFIATRCRVAHISDRDRVAHEILSRYRSGDWPADQVVVTELVTVDSATILISNSANARIDLTADSAIAPMTMSLADASSGLRATHSEGIATQIVANKGLTPLFLASGVRRRLFTGATFELRSADTDPSGESESNLVFVDVDYDG